VALPIAVAVAGAAGLAKASEDVVHPASYPFDHKGPFSAW
jgi:hypothetical protein